MTCMSKTVVLGPLIYPTRPAFYQLLSIGCEYCSPQLSENFVSFSVRNKRDGYDVHVLALIGGWNQTNVTCDLLAEDSGLHYSTRVKRRVGEVFQNGHRSRLAGLYCSTHAQTYRPPLATPLTSLATPPQCL